MNRTIEDGEIAEMIIVMVIIFIAYNKMLVVQWILDIG